MNVSKSTSSRSQPDPEVSIKAIDATFPTLDINRANSYGRLGQVRSAKSSSLAREQKLLSVKHGSANHPRVQHAAAALPYNEQLRGEIAATHEVLETPAPEVDAHSFAVYGFVRRKTQAGIPGLTLALTDEQGNWQRQYGYACTDSRGYFLLRIQRQAGEKTTEREQSPKTEADLKNEAEAKRREELKRAEAEKEAAASGKSAEELKMERERAAAAAGQKEATTSSAAAPSTTAEDAADRLSGGQRIQTNLNQTQDVSARRGLQLRVFNREGRVLHSESRLVVPRADTLDYRLIILGDEDCGCTPPPEKSDGKSDPKSPRAPAAPPSAPAQPAPSAAPEARVAGMKNYQNPPPPDAPRGTQPLEAIRGIGPKRADQLRKAGIDDVSEFSETPGAALVKLAGFDKNQPKPGPAAKPAEAVKPAATAKPAPAPAEKSTAPVRPAAAKPKTTKATSRPTKTAADKKPTSERTKKKPN